MSSVLATGRRSALPSHPLMLSLAVFMALLSAGCATSTVPGQHPILPADLGLEFRQASDGALAAVASLTTADTTLDAATWAGFSDPLLQALVQEARNNNLDVRIAAARVREASAGARAAASRLQPTVHATGSVLDERTGLPDAVKQGSPDTRAVRLGIELGWEIDVWGAAQAAAEAADRDALSAQEGVQTAQWLASTEMARQYLVWQGARLRVKTLEALLAAQTESERLVRRQAEAGQASEFDVSRAAGETQALAAQLPPLRTLVAVTEHQIDLLLGSSPSALAWDWRAGAHAQLPESPRLAPGQPAELLRRRPDLRLAEQRLLAEAARLREREADRWPRLALAAALGQQDLRLNVLDLSPVRFSSVALAMTAPLFNAGRLQAAVERQSSVAERATLEYQRAVLGALRDVENSLVALHEERLRSDALATSRALRQQGLRFAQSLHREGQIGMLPLLDAQRALLAAELAHTESRTQVALGAVQLVSALGGGWHTAATPPVPFPTPAH